MNRLVLLVCFAASLTACPEDKYKASTWTKKLSDPREIERAVTELEHLGDPSAIPALGEAWKDQGKPVRLLQVIIGLANPLTPKEAEDTNMTDYAKTGRPASWESAEPFLKAAIDDVDEANPRSVDSAQKAADALGEAKIADALDSLITISSKPFTKKLIAAQVSAIRAMGKYDTPADKAKAAGALIKLVDREAPQHPRTAADKAEARALEEKYGLFLGVTGAAINALAELRAPSAVKTLTLAMYRTPELFTQIRRALVASGPDAETSLRSVLRGQNPDVEQLFKDKNLGMYCGDKNDYAKHSPPDACLPVSAKLFYPAVVLGDFYDKASARDLLTALKAGPPVPQYYSDDQPSGSTQYNAIFDALRKIGAAEGAEDVHAMFGHGAAPRAAGKGKKGAGAPDAAAAADLTTRILAIGAYPFLTRDGAGTEELGKIAADNGADDNLRTEAATAFARLSRDAADVKILTDLADKYFKASAEHRAKADGKPKADADAADKEFDKAKKAVDDAKANALKATHDTSKSADDIKAATEAAKKAEDTFKEAKKKHRDAIAPFKQEDATAKAYKGYARMFQTHISRIEVALRCGSDLACFSKTLSETADDASKNCTKFIKDINEWTKDEKLGLLEGEVERAMLEIGKQGAKSESYTSVLLDSAKSDDRLIRQSILLALPKIAKVPCDTCEKKLDDAIKAGEGKSTLGDLNLETTMLRNYFAWAGGRTPSSSSSSSDAPSAPAAPAAPAKGAPPPAKAAPAKAAPGKKK
jgi:hypothetical protein